MVLRVRLMYLFQSPCYVHRSLVYMDPSYVLYIRQTFYKMPIVYYYGTVLCTLIIVFRRFQTHSDNIPYGAKISRNIIFAVIAE